MPPTAWRKDPRALRRLLLAWYDAEGRDLPWRRTKDPWAILVSEVMLQQTRVAAVIPYWRSFVRRWPNPAALAAASREQLLAAWSGLGYNRRAHLLLDGALAVAEAGGELPKDSSGLRRLPGVGEYTAAAVASIAYGEPSAVVDGNVARVLSRLLADAGDPRRAAGKRRLRAAADELLDRRRPGDSNQALMELGATRCLPRAPRCEGCPLEQGCAARAEGRPERYPRTQRRPQPLSVTRLAALIPRAGRVLMLRREMPPNAGFLELPGPEPVPARGEDAPRAGASTLAAWLAATFGLRARLHRALPVERHSILRWRIRLHPYLGTLAAGRPRAPLAWIDPADRDVPLTTASRRVLARWHAAQGAKEGSA